jgi:hypothetical protein
MRRSSTLSLLPPLTLASVSSLPSRQIATRARAVASRRNSVTRYRLGPKGAAALSALAVTAVAFAIPTGGLRATAQGGGEDAHGVKALSGYSVSVFASATKDYFGPDSIIVNGKHVFVDYQNKTAKDCSDATTKSSTVVEYTLDGDVVRAFSVPGHSDGMRMDPVTGDLWTLSCEDGNPQLTVINFSSGTTTPYTFDSLLLKHGGGYDDIAFIGGKVYLTASNPTLDINGQNLFPAVEEVKLQGSKVVRVRDVLMGNASATDLNTGKTVTLNEIDPDSLYVTPSGDLQVDNQGGTELVFIKNPGSTATPVSRLGIGNQQDDTIFPTAKSGQLLVSDTTAGKVYSIRSDNFVTTKYYSAAPSDSGVAGFVGTIDPTLAPPTGIVSPLVIGMVSPHGEAFIAGDGEGDG